MVYIPGRGRKAQQHQEEQQQAKGRRPALPDIDLERLKKEYDRLEISHQGLVETVEEALSIARRGRNSQAALEDAIAKIENALRAIK